MNKKALLGLHNPIDIDSYAWMFEDKGFTVDTVGSLNGMLEKIACTEYDWYFMDGNLGILAGEDITPAKKVYEIVRDRVERGEARFLALSYSDHIVSKVQELGIPAMNKVKFRYFMVEQKGDQNSLDSESKNAS